MCGICGLVKFGNTGFNLDKVLIKTMNDKLIHRGPDEDGYYFDFSSNFEVGFAMRRLSIIDLVTGKQPIKNEDGSVIVILNGEIYNYKELKIELEKKKHKFYTQSDTETIAHLYEDYGTGLVSKLRGMYAFAIYDKKNRKIILARDRLGKKPLFYTFGPGYFAFASEMKSLLEIPNFKKEVDLNSIDEYLTYGYISSPGSIFKSVTKLKPASIIVFDGKETKIERYWDLNYRNKIKITYREAKEELSRILEESVKIRLYSDVPLGAFLSGGIDSSIIVAIMSKLIPRPVKTFSIGFEEQDFSELKFAKLVADKFHTEHTEILVKPDAIEDLPKLVYFYGEPFSDSSALPSYYVCREARKHVTVALNGDGGDESFAGYIRYKINIVSGWLSFFSKIFFMDKFNRKVTTKIFPENLTIRRIKKFMETLTETKERRNLLWYITFSNQYKEEMYTDNMKKNLFSDKYEILIDTVLQAKADSYIEKFLYSDVMQYLPEDLLVKMDIASMMNSLEARSPFLDHKLMELVASFPPEYKIKCLKSKYILKDLFSKILPEEIVNRQKMGFGVPINYWFKGELKNYINDMLLDKTTLDRGYFKKEAIKKIIDEHWSDKMDHRYRLWNLLFLEIWHRIYVDQSIKIG